MIVQVNVTSSPGQTASPLSTDEVKIKQSMTDVNQYMHDTAEQCKSEDIVNVVRRYRLKNFQLPFCDCGVQGLSTSHNYSSHCEISMIVISQILLCPVFMRMTYNCIFYVYINNAYTW